MQIARRFPLVALAVLPHLLTAAEAKPPECTEIVEKARAHAGMGIDSGLARIALTIQPAKGAPRHRTLEVRSAREKGLVRTLIRFLEPADVAGTAFLLRENADGPDEQILYLPALKRTRRIAGTQRRGSFMGTDFSYADLEVRSLDDAECTLEGEQSYRGQETYVVVTRPKAPSEDDLYGSVKLWIHKKTWIPLKVEFYDREDGALSKVMTVKRLKKVEGHWLPVETEMKNVKKGSSTRLELVEVEPGKSFPPETFTERALER